MHLTTPRYRFTLPAFTMLDGEGRLSFERRFLLLRLTFLPTAAVLLLTYGPGSLAPALSIATAVLLDCGFVWLLLRFWPAFVLRAQIGLRMLDIAVAYVVLLYVHSYLGNTYYDSAYIFFVVGATATHGQRGMIITAAAATVAVFLGRLQLILMGVLPFAPRHISDIVYYGLLFGATGVTTGFLMTKSTEKHHYLALHDSLTGLPNRALFQDRLQQALLAARRSTEGVSVLIIDLDRFKEINDRFGHHYGDLLLKEIASRVRARLRASDTVARLGGDEFAVVLPATDAAGAEHVVRAIHQTLEKPVFLEDRAFDIAASIGVAAYPDHGEDATALLRHADIAMYVAKQQDTTRTVYHPFDNQYSSQRASLMGDLALAIEANRLSQHFQPRDFMESGEVEGVEALLRSNHPTHGDVPPEVFIPPAEHTSLIWPLTRFALEGAVEQALRLHEAGIPLQMAVHLSVRSLHDPNLDGTILHLMPRSPHVPSQL
jgi:diguanylate cyclase (GGDEF)-like protein